jgi:hypothetical protein
MGYPELEVSLLDATVVSTPFKATVFNMCETREMYLPVPKVPA